MVRKSFALPLLAISLIMLVAAPLGAFLPAWANEPPPVSPLALPMHPAVTNAWLATDGPVVNGDVERAWTFGPAATAMTVEYYAQSPTGLRQMVYFDKGRLDIYQPSAPADDPWFAEGGLLVSEMISGEIQFGEDEFVANPPAEIAVAGDLDQPNPVTYASFAALRASQQVVRPGDDRLLSLATAPAVPARVGGQISSTLAPDGTVNPIGVPHSQVVIGAYDDASGHNIAAPFAAWDAAQPFPPTWLLGHPISEPYWIDTVVLGTPKQILVQAFERRMLTYTPDIPSAWQVESANVGTHYRMWRGLSQPGDLSLTGLASLEPSGEEIVAAATANGVDPYLLAAIARVASGGNPLATSPTGGAGLLGVQPLQGGSTALNPFANAVSAAQELASIAAGDLRTQLAAYFQPANPDLNDPDLAQLVDGTLATADQLRTTYAPHAEAPADPVQKIEASGAALQWWSTFDAGWWDRSLSWYGSWGGAVAGWQPDPNGYYCLHPDFAPGDRLRLIANGVTIDCTVGGVVPVDERAGWGDGWAVELNDAAYAALHLEQANNVTVARIGATEGQKTRAVDSNSLSTSPGSVVTQSGVWIGSGQAAYYSPSYGRAWWEWAMSYYNAKGVITPGWNLDPNGYYCVHPNYLPGDRLRLVANGVTIDCTVGDMVADQDVYNWRQRFAVELGWDTFTALGLQHNNSVEVYYLGAATKPERYGRPPADEPTTEPVVTNDPTPTPAPEPPAATPTPEPTPDMPTPTPAPTPEPVVTPTEAPTPVAETATPLPEPTAVPTEAVPVEPTAVSTEAAPIEDVPADSTDVATPGS